LEEFIDQEQLKQDISFSPDNLTDAFMQQAALFAYYATLSARAQHQADKRKHALEIVEAKAGLQIREAMAAKKEKVTEGIITSRVQLNDVVVKATSDYNEAKMIAALCKSTTEAFSQKRDMLIQSGADQRGERKGELRMNAISGDSAGMGQRALDALKKQ